MIVYIAGPMTGYDDYNRKAFYDAEIELSGAGYTVINPAKMPTTMEDKQYMPICIAMVEQADAVYPLKGWQNSIGALTEITYAYRQNKKVIVRLDNGAFTAKEKDAICIPSLKTDSCDYETERKAIEVFGALPQQMLAVEEMAELMQAISKFLRYGTAERRDNIIEEMADVTIMLEQLRIIYNITAYELEARRDLKIARLKDSLLKAQLKQRRDNPKG